MQVQSLDQEDPLEEGMATHHSILAWRIPWTEEPGCKLSLTYHSIASLVAQLVKNLPGFLYQCGRPGFDPWVGKIPWRRERLSTLVFWPRELHGLYSPWVRKELDTTHFSSLHHSIWVHGLIYFICRKGFASIII